MAADRGAFIDQSQSFNVHMAETNVSKMTSMHFYAWKKVGVVMFGCVTRCICKTLLNTCTHTQLYTLYTYPHIVHIYIYCAYLLYIPSYCVHILILCTCTYPHIVHILIHFILNCV